MIKTQETCRCAVALCELHNSAPELLDLLKRAIHPMFNSYDKEQAEKVIARIKAATKAEGR